MRRSEPRPHLALVAIAAVSLVTSATRIAHAEPPSTPGSEPQREGWADRFAELESLPWRKSFEYAGKQPWGDAWSLDGEKARVRRLPPGAEGRPGGFELHAGPKRGEDASHAVAWTRPEFAGDLRIEYEFTRLDDVDWGVNIVYLQAQGLGPAPFTADIAQWADRRNVPAMPVYYRNMSLWHVSYAAYPTRGDAPKDYLRARRYPSIPKQWHAPQHLFGDVTRVDRDYRDTGLFKQGQPVRLTWIKRGSELMLRAVPLEGDDVKPVYFRWDFSRSIPVWSGRIGLRQMSTRDSRYRGFTISTLPEGESVETRWREVDTVAEFVAAFPSRAEMLIDALDLTRPDLAAVKEAVDAGDRVGALSALLTHYRERAATLPDAAWEQLGVAGADAIRRMDAERRARLIGRAEAALDDRFHRVNHTAAMPRTARGGLHWRWFEGRTNAQWTTQVSRHREWMALLAGWRITEDPRYAARFDEFVRDWCVANDVERKSRYDLLWLYLNVGIRMSRPWPATFLGFQDSDEFRPATRLLMLASIVNHAQHLQTEAISTGNWATMELNGQTTVGALFSEFRDSDLWLRTGLERLRAELDQQFYPDGAHDELSSTYHGVAVRNLWDAFGIARAVGVEGTRDIKDRFERAFGYYFDIITPALTYPQNGDTDRRPIHYNAAGEVDRPEWRHIRTRGAEGRPPAEPPSRYRAWPGQLISRDGWGPDAQYSFFDVGAWGTSHQHDDMLQLSIEAGGRQLLVDSGRFAYDGPVAEKFRGAYANHSRGHNVILVDGFSQANATAKAPRPHPWGAVRNGFDFAMAEFTHGFSDPRIQWDDAEPMHRAGNRPLDVINTRHRRAVVYLRGRGWLVLDRVTPDRAGRTVEALWHFAPDVTIERDGTQNQLVSRDAGVVNVRLQPLLAGEEAFELSLVRGQDQPHPQGWYAVQAGDFGPATCAIYRSKSAASRPMVFGWLITPGEDAGAVPEPVGVKVHHESARRFLATLSWPDGATSRVAVALDGASPIDLGDDLQLRGLAAVHDGQSWDVALGRIVRTDDTGRATEVVAVHDIAGTRGIDGRATVTVDDALRTWLGGLAFAGEGIGTRFTRVSATRPGLGYHTRSQPIVAPAWLHDDLHLNARHHGAARDTIGVRSAPGTPAGKTAWAPEPAPALFTAPDGTPLDRDRRDQPFTPNRAPDTSLIARSAGAVASVPLRVGRHQLTTIRHQDLDAGGGRIDAIADALSKQVPLVIVHGEDRIRLGELRFLVGAGHLAMAVDVFDPRFEPGEDPGNGPASSAIEFYVTRPGRQIAQVIVHPNRPAAKRLSFYRNGSQVELDGFPCTVEPLPSRAGYRVQTLIPLDRFSLPEGADTFDFEAALYAQPDGHDGPVFVTVFGSDQPFRWRERYARIRVEDAARPD